MMGEWGGIRRQDKKKKKKKKSENPKIQKDRKTTKLIIDLDLESFQSPKNKKRSKTRTKNEKY